MAKANKKTSVKHIKIGKDQSTILLVTIAATVITVFSLFALRAMVVKGLYNHKALNAKEDVVKQLKSNLDAANKLATQYNVFAEQNPNILGGNKDGNGALDGSNPRISLDALPSKYDAPALAASIEKLLKARSALITSLTVKDDPASNSDTPQSQPKAAAMPFSYEIKTTFVASHDVLTDFERSIRPFDVTKLEMSGRDKDLKVIVTGSTYFQPSKSLNLDATKEVKQ